MKIALIHRFYPLQGGVTTIVNQLAEGLEKEGIEFKIICQNRAPGKNVQCFPSKYSGEFYWKVFKYLKKEKFDLIHTHSSFAAFFSPFLKEKIALTIHGFDKNYEPIGFFKEFKENMITCKLKALAYRFADFLIPVSKLVKQNLTHAHHLSPKKMKVILNGTDTSLFRPIKVKRSKIPRIFQYDTAKRKGFDKIILWVKKLSEKHDFKVVVAGGTQKVPREIKDYFEFVGNLSQKDMAKMYSSCDFGILPSLYDPFGLTTSEMMACERPMIVSKFSGSKEIIENGEDGFVTSFKDFPSKMEYLLEHPKKCGTIGKKARRKVITKASSELLVKNHIKLYKQLIY